MFEYRRRALAFFILLGLIWVAGNAQNYGIKMYYNFAKNSFGIPDQENYASQYALGPYIELRFIPFLSISVECLLAKKGGIKSPPSKKGIEYRLTYVSLPMLVNLYVIPIGPVQVFISGGLEYSYLLFGKAYDLDLDSELENFLKGKLARKDNSYLVGGGLRINLIITKVILEGRYSSGKQDVFLPQYLGEFNSFKNRVFSFGIGFIF